MNTDASAAALIAAMDKDASAESISSMLGASEAEKAIARLALSPTARERGYVPLAARLVLGEGALPLLLKLLDDSDADVRGEALDQLELLDPSIVQRLAPRLRERLARSNNYEALSIAWRLAVLKDEAAVALIEDFRDCHPEGNWQHKAADIVLAMLLEPDAIPRRIRTHDHDHMPWLAYGASLLRTGEAMDALDACADGAPDADCRAYCRARLKP